MITPLLARIQNTTGAYTKYAGLVGTMFYGQTTSGKNHNVIPTNGVIGSLFGIASSAFGVSNSQVIELLVNGVSKNKITISGASQTEDTDYNTYAVSAGDVVEYKITQAGSPSSGIYVYLQIDFISDTAGESIILGGSSDSNGTNFSRPVVLTGASNQSTATAKSIPIPTAGTIKKLYTKLSIDPGTNPDEYDVRLIKNGSATALSANVIADNTAGNDTTNNISVSAGDILYIQPAQINTPSANPQVGFGMVFVPTVDGESIVGGFDGTALSTSASHYHHILGEPLATGGTSEASQMLRIRGFVAKKLFSALDGSPGTSKSYAFTLVKSGSASALTTTISGTSVAGNDTTHSVSLAKNTISILTAPTGTPTARAGSWSMVLVASSKEYLLPSANNTNSGWDAEGGPDYTSVDDPVSTPDDATTAVYSPTAGDYFDVALADTALTTETINMVSAYYRTLQLDPDNAKTRPYLIIGGTKYYGDSTGNLSNNTTYVTHSYDWLLNPATSSAWTVSDLNGLILGIENVSGPGRRCTQMYVVVDYSASGGSSPSASISPSPSASQSPSASVSPSSSISPSPSSSISPSISPSPSASQSPSSSISPSISKSPSASQSPSSSISPSISPSPSSSSSASISASPSPSSSISASVSPSPSASISASPSPSPSASQSSSSSISPSISPSPSASQSPSSSISPSISPSPSASQSPSSSISPSQSSSISPSPSASQSPSSSISASPSPSSSISPSPSASQSPSSSISPSISKSPSASQSPSSSISPSPSSSSSASQSPSSSVSPSPSPSPSSSPSPSLAATCVIDQSQVNSPNVHVIGNPGTYAKMAQSFQPSKNADICNIEVLLAKSGSPTDNVVLELYSDNAGSPGTLLATSPTTVAGASLTASYVAFNFAFNSGTTLVANTSYWFVLSRSSTLNASHVFLTKTDDSADIYTRGESKYWNSTTLAWVHGASTYSDMYFRQYYDTLTASSPSASISPSPSASISPSPSASQSPSSSISPSPSKSPSASISPSPSSSSSASQSPSSSPSASISPSPSSSPSASQSPSSSISPSPSKSPSASQSPSASPSASQSPSSSISASPSPSSSISSSISKSPSASASPSASTSSSISPSPSASQSPSASSSASISPSISKSPSASVSPSPSSSQSPSSSPSPSQSSSQSSSPSASVSQSPSSSVSASPSPSVSPSPSASPSSAVLETVYPRVRYLDITARITYTEINIKIKRL